MSVGRVLTIYMRTLQQAAGKLASLILFVGSCTLHAQSSQQSIGLSTISDLKSLDITSNINYPENTVIEVLGYWAAHDGGGGKFRLQRSSGNSLASDNSGTVIAPTDNPNTGIDESTLGRWIRICDPGVVNVLWFGARPDSDSSPNSAHFDSLPAIRKAFESLTIINSIPDESGNPGRVGVLYFPKVNYKTPNGATEQQPSRWTTTYFISDTLIVSQRVTIRGDGYSNSAIRFLNGAAPNSSLEKFVLYFARGGDDGPAGNTTFECGVEKISILGSPDGNDLGSSGVFMDPAQMSFIRDAQITYVGLRGIVGAPYTIENVSLGARRGPGLDVNNDQPGLLGQPIGGSDTKVHVSNLFIGNVDEQLLQIDPSTNEYYPAIRLKNCNQFICADLRAERCVKLLHAESCDSLVINSVFVYDFPPPGANPPFPPTGAIPTKAIYLDRVGRVHFSALRLQPFATGLYDTIPSSWAGAGTRSYPWTITSWHRGVNGGSIEYDDINLGTRVSKIVADGDVSTSQNLVAVANVFGANVYATGNMSSNNVYTNALTTTGQIGGANSVRTGTLTANSATVSGTMSTGALTASSAAIAGAISAGSATISGNLVASQLSATTLSNPISGNPVTINNLSASTISTASISVAGSPVPVAQSSISVVQPVASVTNPGTVILNRASGGPITTTWASGLVPIKAPALWIAPSTQYSVDIQLPSTSPILNRGDSVTASFAYAFPGAAAGGGASLLPNGLLLESSFVSGPQKITLVFRNVKASGNVPTAATDYFYKIFILSDTR